MHDRRWRKQFEKVEPDGDGWHPTDGGFLHVSMDEPEMPLFALGSQADDGDRSEGDG